jgi:hypothetical protein
LIVFCGANTEIQVLAVGDGQEKFPGSFRLGTLSQKYQNPSLLRKYSLQLSWVGFKGDSDEARILRNPYCYLHWQPRRGTINSPSDTK